MHKKLTEMFYNSYKSLFPLPFIGNKIAMIKITNVYSTVFLLIVVHFLYFNFFIVRLKQFAFYNFQFMKKK